MRQFDKIARVYSEQREQQIAVRIQYNVTVSLGCPLTPPSSTQQLCR